MTDKIAAILNALDEDRTQALERLFSFLKIKSISTDPAFKADCRAAAEWSAATLNDIGFDASIRDTTGHPMVVGHYRSKAPGNVPHVLFYGHYDVQPPDPLDLWDTPPFEPQIKNDSSNGEVIVARGSSDDKGQLLTFLEAMRAWKSVTGDLPLNVTVLLEGEEECGSPSLAPFLDANADELKADLALVCDTGQWDRDTPAITTMLRGLASVEIIVRGANRDLHSGMFGGVAVNAARALATVLASLHDSEGRVLIPGFYDGIKKEGGEECGSPSLAPFLDANADELKADLALVCDTGQWDRDTPAITTMLRGLASVEIIVRGANRDLHSGMFGGVAVNAARALATVLASLHDSEGRVLIPGFYDGIIEPSETQQEQWSGIAGEAAAMLNEIGMSKSAGEAGRGILEQIWSRPTAEINGLIGGYTGPGVKTVIPAEASAKLSFRLVPGQDPAKILAAFEDHARSNLSYDCSVEFRDSSGSPAIVFDPGSPQMKAGARALEAEFGKAPIMMGCGGSIPIVERFRSKLGMDTLLIGFALDDDRIHAPNEKYNLSSFSHGARAWVRIVDELGYEPSR